MFPTSVRLNSGKQNVKDNVCNGESFSVAAASEQERLQGCRTPLVSENKLRIQNSLLRILFLEL